MKKTRFKLIFSILFIILLIGSVYIYIIHQRVYGNNLVIQTRTSIHIPSDSEYEDVLQIIDSASIVKNISSFKWVAEKMDYPSNIHAGHYIIEPDMNNKEFIARLRSGTQTPVNITFNNIKTIKGLCSKIARQLEPDSAAFSETIHDKAYIESLGFTEQTIIGMFIPNTYELYWNIGPKDFYNRMAREYEKFWTQTREKKRKKLNLERNDVSTLASIIEQESYHKDEYKRIAGVYINRLRKRMHLQADPTIRYIIGDSTRRVLNHHLKKVSPYNTYLNYGLPPGPISIPSISAIDAVLDFEDHDYIYFCAKPDLTGYHNFTHTLKEHNRNARAYQQALNKKKIWK